MIHSNPAAVDTNRCFSLPKNLCGPRSPLGVYRRKTVAVVGSGLTLALTGCIQLKESSEENPGGDIGESPAVSLQMISVADTEIARRLTYSLDVAHRTSERELATTVIENGSKTVRNTNEPFPPETPFVYDDELYELTAEVINSQPAVVFRVTLEKVDDTDAETIAYDDLPPVDKQALEEYGWDDPDVFEVGGAPFVYMEDEVSESVLVPGPDQPVIVWDSGIQAQIIIESRSENTVKEFTYSARVVHESAKGYGEEIRQEHEFQLPNLPEAQERIVSKAISDEHGYKVLQDESTPDSFDELIEHFSDEETVTPEHNTADSTVSGVYIVEYEETNYWTEVFRPEDRNETSNS